MTATDHTCMYMYIDTYFLATVNLFVYRMLIDDRPVRVVNFHKFESKESEVWRSAQCCAGSDSSMPQKRYTASRAVGVLQCLRHGLIPCIRETTNAKSRALAWLPTASHNQ